MGIISFSGLFTGTLSAAAEDAKNLEICLLVALSGFGFGAETLIDQGAKMAMESINKAGGITIK